MQRSFQNQSLPDNSAGDLLKADAASILRERFLRWHCRLRQLVMRERMGRPDETIMAQIFFPGQKIPAGQIITLLLKSEKYSQTLEFKHMVLNTHDPAQRLESAVKFFSASYYQNALQFNDSLVASFAPKSNLVSMLYEKKTCNLNFQAYGENFNLHCTVTRLESEDDLFQAAWWHNNLFNPAIQKEITFLCFTPDWVKSKQIP